MDVEMIYRIEFGSWDFTPGRPPKWVIEWMLEYETFERAKECIKHISQDVQNDVEYHKEEKTQVRMTDDSNEKNPRIYHYITAQYPGVTLPSKELK
jgi:hypothetical protein